jgi:Domain of unknown function (DUF892)
MPAFLAAVRSGTLRHRAGLHRAPPAPRRPNHVFIHGEKLRAPFVCRALDTGHQRRNHEGMPALDAGFLAAAQAVEHYEISRYGTLKCWAKELGYKRCSPAARCHANQEKNTDSTLRKIAESEVNLRRKPHKKLGKPAIKRPRLVWRLSIFPCVSC